MKLELCFVLFCFLRNTIRVLIEGEKLLLSPNKWYRETNKTLNSLCNNYSTS